ncbi:hypothetical protein ACFL3S_12705 [Gemmatimonadota bacterium]
MTPFRIGLFSFGILVGIGGQAIAAQEISPDSAFLSSGSYTEASTLLEKTIFRVDAAILTLRLGAETTSALRDLVRQNQAPESVEERVVALVVRARDASARLQFLRGIGFERFLNEIRDGVETSRKAGLVDRAFARSLSDSFPVWYSPLRDRGVRDGDAMFYFISGDTLRTVFRTGNGEVLVDEINVGSMPRLSVLGGFLGPGSDFRRGLLESLSRAISGDPEATGSLQRLLVDRGLACGEVEKAAQDSFPDDLDQGG